MKKTLIRKSERFWSYPNKQWWRFWALTGETIPLSLLVEGRWCFGRGNFGISFYLGTGLGSDGALLSMVLGSTILAHVWVWAGRTSGAGPSVVVGKTIFMFCLRSPKGLHFGFGLQTLHHSLLKKCKVLLLPRTGVRILLAPKAETLIICDGCLVATGARYVLNNLGIGHQIWNFQWNFSGINCHKNMETLHQFQQCIDRVLVSGLYKY